MPDVPKMKPMIATVINHVHDDGRSCFVHDEGNSQFWAHYKDNIRYVCSRSHPVAEERKVDIRGPEPIRVRPPEGSAGLGDAERGRFGMPTMGGAFTPSPGEEDADAPWIMEFGGVVSDDDDIVSTLSKDGLRVAFSSGKGNMVPAETDDAQYILTDVIPELLERFLIKNAKYALAQDIDLGVKGIVPDINRKASVIINRLWHGNGMVDEDTEEVIDDLIGHLLLMRAKLRSR